MSNSEKLLKTLSNLIENGILTSRDIQKEVSTDLKFTRDKLINKLELVSREEFDVLKKLVQKQAIDINPERPEARHAYVSALIKLSQNDEYDFEILKNIETLMKRDPNDFRARQLGGYFYKKKRDWDNAVKFFDSNCWILEFKVIDGIIFEINPAEFDVPETLGDVEAIIKQFLSDSINRQGAYAAFIGRESSNES